MGKFLRIGDMTVGEAPVDSIELLRENYRKMNKQQVEALKQSIDQHGFQSFVLVCENGDGKYELIDGHHRLEEAKRRGMKNIPILVLPRGSDGKEQLARLQFNVSAEILADKQYQFLKELSSSLALDDVAIAAAIQPAFLKDLTSLMERQEITPELPDVVQDSAKSAKPKKGDMNGLLVVQATEELMQLVRVPSTFVVSKKMHEAAEAQGVGIVHFTEVPVLTTEAELESVISAIAETRDAKEAEEETTDED